ncbi:MAG: efflux RND transporter permease subunit, partial [Bacteroidota bacterium]|nr:efflux RND transporter permease subunit [Bacteroidota bacterium]
DAPGEFIRCLPVAVMSSVLASLLVSLTLVPFMASLVLKSNHNQEGNIFLRALKKGIHATYSRLLDVALRRPLATLIGAFAIFGLSLGVFKIIGFKLFPSSEKPEFMINIHAPLQSNIETTDSISRYVESVLHQEPNVEYFTTNVGKGNPRIYYNVIPENEKPDFSQVFVQLYPDVSPQKKKRIIESLRMKFSGIPGSKIEVKDFEQGPPIEAPIAVRIKGENLDTLRSLADSVEQILRATPGAIYVNNDIGVLKSDLKLHINREKSRTLGISTASIENTVRLAIAGLTIGTFTDSRDNDYDIVVNTPRKTFPTLNSLRNLYVDNALGTPIPLDQVTRLEFESSPTTIKHLDKKRFVVVTAFTGKGYLADQIAKNLTRRLNEIKLPAGYHWQLAGEAESEQDAFGGSFMTVVIATIFLFLMILILEFKTFKSMLIVLSVIPLGIIGGITLLWITGNPMSFVAIVGFIGLAGVEVKNSILLVDFTNQLRAEGMGLEEAIREAGELRFLPIILTSLTAIGGLLPIALSSNPLISPLALVLIGGLISSTLLSRIVTPVVYKLIPPKVIPNQIK